MFKTLVPLSSEQHSDLNIKPIDEFEFASEIHMASVMVQEMPKAANVYPVVFIEGSNSEFTPVAVMGLKPGENLFVDEAGLWNAHYIPAIIRRYPFALANSEVADQFSVCIDVDSPMVSTDEGNPLFDDDRNPTEVVENVKRYLGELQQMEVATQAFCTAHNRVPMQRLI